VNSTYKSSTEQVELLTLKKRTQ